MTGLHSELLITKDSTENEFCINTGLMTAELFYRVLDVEGLETLSMLYFSANHQG